MAYFNEDNVTEQMCIAVAKEAMWRCTTRQILLLKYIKAEK